MTIRYFDTLESTNNYCKLLDPKSVGEFTVIWTGNQTAGIGQQGNVWVSEPLKNLTFSLVLKPSFLPLADQWLLSMTLAVAISDCLNRLFSEFKIQKTTFIKWPNDIYVGNNKICGILVTNQVSGGIISQAICGIGLNVNQTLFPDWVPNPTSLFLETGKEHDIKNLLIELVNNIKLRYQQLKDAPTTIKPIYMSRLFRLNQPAEYIYQGEQITATITDVDHQGHLHLTTQKETEISCALKEIQFVI